MSDTFKMIVEMNVTMAQAITLKEMFDYMTSLGKLGGSREVGFYSDGDGNFHPNCVITTEKPLIEMKKEDLAKAIVRDKGGDRMYDYDPIAWRLKKE